MRQILLILLCVIFALNEAYAQNEHWSRQFKKPASSTEMLPSTGMSNGMGNPSIRQVKWHEGKLWFSGSWAVTNSVRWTLWTWSPVDGWEAVTYHHTAQGGAGPLDAKINDFLWLPDGRLVVAGEFAKVDNPGGVRYRAVSALAVYDKDEPTANKWKPLGSFQYNGSIGGSIMKLAYDKQGNDLYMVGTLSGIPGKISSPGIHKYNLDTKVYVPLKGGIYKSGRLKSINAIYIDESTKPSTIYVGGVFQWVGGDGNNPKSGGTSLWATGVASYQEGRDGGFGWRNYAELKKATGFISTSTMVRTIAIINGELWIGGAFEDKANPKVRGIAKWDKKAKKWVDPTGKGGVGRDVFQMAQAENGKVYFAGAFGGRRSKADFYDGFKNGDPAHMAMSYDPKTKKWEQLGGGLFSVVMPECRLTVHGNDVYYAGDFTHFGSSDAPKNESYFVAHWNENDDFATAPVITAKKTLPSTLTVNVDGGSGTWKYSLNGGAAQESNTFTGLGYGIHKVTVTNGTYTEDIYAEFKNPIQKEVAIGGDQNIHWSRQFPHPKHNGGKMGVNTGMKDGSGAPIPSCLAWHDDVLYFSGSWEANTGERWFMWTWDKKNGWKKLAWKKGSSGEGIKSPPRGFKWHDGKLYVYGAMEAYSGLAVYDPASKKWSAFSGKYNGHNVKGLASSNGGGIINDVEWDSKGNMYFVGSWAWNNKIFPGNLASAVRVTPSGEYQPLGKSVFPYKDGRAVGIYKILIDETKTPADMYIGGTFRYIQGDIHSTTQAYNVAKWNHKKNDWTAMGVNADGNPGLPAYTFKGFEFNGSYPIVRDLIMDKNGVLYAAGSLAIFDENPDMTKRDEHFGIVKFDKAKNKWVGVVDCGGVTRDIYQMSWLDDKTLLLSGSFNHANDFTYLGNAAKLDVTTGKLTGLGGGLRRAGLAQTIGSTVVHAIKGNELYFFGFFDHAGVNANSNIEAPNSSSYIAMWDGTKNFDPNQGLETDRLITVAASNPNSSEKVKIDFKAWGAAKSSTYEWFYFSSNKYVKEATGAKVSMTLRGKPGDEMYRYVAVRNSDGVLGGKLKVTIRFIHKDKFTAAVPYIIYDESTQKLSCSLSGISYEWYKDGTKLSGNTRSIASEGKGSYKVVVVSGKFKSKESDAYVIAGANAKPVANAGVDQTVKAGDVVTLDGTKSTDADGDNITYKWTAPSGITLDNATAAKPKFTAPDVKESKDYTFSLVVNDGKADSKADEVIIKVVAAGVNAKPVANAGDDQTVEESDVVTLDGTKSSDADGDKITYKWTVPEGITLDDVAVAKPQFTAPNVEDATDFTFALVVNDGKDDSEADEVVITVNPKSTGFEELEVGEITVYPNPVTDYCTIKLDCKTSSHHKISVINSSGQTISILSSKKLTSGVNTINWDATNVQKGIYFIKVENQKGSIVHRIIIK